LRFSNVCGSGRADVVMWDVMRIDPNQVIKVVFEGGTSPWRQGVWLKTDRGASSSTISLHQA
jgi:hypothetical protein